MTIKHVVALGECMAEFAPLDSGDFRLGFAGDTFNTAVYLRRELSVATAKVSYLSCIADDILSEKMLNTFVKHGLATELVFEQQNSSIGAYLIHNDASGERSFSYWRKGSAASRLLESGRADKIINCLKTTDLLYLSGISLAILAPAMRNKLLEILKASKVSIAFDPNYRPLLWSSKQDAKQCFAQTASISQYLLTTLSDDQLLWPLKNTNDSLAHWRDTCDGEIIVKNGDQAALGALGKNIHYLQPQTVDDIKDTTGAGDSFNAGYLAARLKNQSIDLAMSAGHCLAAKVIANQGAIIDLA